MAVGWVSADDIFAGGIAFSFVEFPLIAESHEMAKTLLRRNCREWNADALEKFEFLVRNSELLLRNARNICLRHGEMILYFLFYATYLGFTITGAATSSGETWGAFCVRDEWVS
jgi:hypothetical protein